MAQAQTTTFIKASQNQLTGVVTGQAKIVVTGLTAATASTIPHGLPRTPIGEPNYVAQNGVPGFETSPADGTNFYYTTGAGQTGLNISCEY
jgi:hypothetical protein